MDIWIVVVLNGLLTAGFYTYFHYQFKRAIKESKKNAMTRDLRENVESAIEYINTALDVMENRSRSFYNLVRKSEEIKKELLNLVERIELDSIEKKSEKVKTKKSKKSTGSAKSKTGVKANRMVDFEEEPTQENDYFDRLAERTRDSLDLTSMSGSVDEVYHNKTNDRKPLNQNPANENVAISTIRTIGQFVFRMMGSGSPTEDHPTGGESDGRKAAESVNFEKALDTARIVSARKNQGETTPNRKNAAETEDTVNRYGDRYEPGEVPSPASKNTGTYARKKNQSENGLNSDDFQGREKEDELQTKSVYVDLLDDYSKDVIENRREPKKDEKQNEHHEFLIMMETLRNSRDFGERHTIIKSLMDAGISTAEIAAASGLGMAEIDLIASLPDSGNRPRKKRLVEQ